MVKAPEYVRVGCSYSQMKIEFEKGEIITLDFGTGQRSRSLRYTIEEVKRDQKGNVYYFVLKRGGSY